MDIRSAIDMYYKFASSFHLTEETNQLKQDTDKSYSENAKWRIYFPNGIRLFIIGRMRHLIDSSKVDNDQYELSDFDSVFLLIKPDFPHGDFDKQYATISRILSKKFGLENEKTGTKVNSLSYDNVPVSIVDSILEEIGNISGEVDNI